MPFVGETRMRETSNLRDLFAVKTDYVRASARCPPARASTRCAARAHSTTHSHTHHKLSTKFRKEKFRDQKSNHEIH